MKVVILCALLLVFGLALDNGLGKTPPMGWNSWNRFGCNINEDLIIQTVDALLSTGLAKAGYTYVNLDDCWQKDRDRQGYILPDAKAFPHGMKYLANYIHLRGLKFGLYSDAGLFTCQKRPGGLNFEELDAQRYAEWEVDYLKYDNCFNTKVPTKERYGKMRDALNKTGRPIYFSICEWGEAKPWKWGKEFGNSWRTTGDISDTWASMLSILDKQVNIASAGGPGGWNDPDMLEVGNGGMTTSEYEAHFALWALLKAPLLIGCDITKMSADTARILMNAEIIAVNQDPLGTPGRRVSKNGDLEVWAGPLTGNDVAVILFNRGRSSATMTADFKQVGFTDSDCAKVRDLYAGANLGSFTKSYATQVGSHGVKVLRLTRGVCQSKTETMLRRLRRL
eukprot:TRINITY_DN9163_c0_g2_i1.p1 TRINITY_DN9163_c0_g2~~TRINITY_DN9163_c0_g2_i1.p1  ORF type:complete len:394 (+),score=79.03 TRINITY_DN9163_c0_g2_i1:67-1248(+)